MKKNLILMAAIIAVSVFGLTSCQKSNDFYSETGKAGKDGTAVLSGAGIPNFAIGKVGDMFIDTIGKVMWGPKNNSSWGAGFALVGPTGLPGKSMLHGGGVQSGFLGLVGDFYIDQTAKTLYGPKTASGWGVATNLVGATGAAGGTGATGAAGTPAQVIYSPWITAPSNSRDTTIDGTCVRVRDFAAPSLSAAILNQGVMITYMKVGSIGPYALPYTSDAGGATNTVNCIYNQQKILVYRHTFNTCRFNSGIAESYPGQPVLINLPQSLEYRYVFIPGLISGGRSAATATNYATMPYADVCKMLGIAQ
jgi:hypothetical protein